MISVDAIILASGLSKRMGEEKLLLPFANSTILDYFLSHFPFILFNKVFLVASDKTARLVGDKYPLNICLNSQPEQGKSFAIRLGAQQSRAADGLLFSVADQPLLEQDTVTRLLNTFAQEPKLIIIPRAEGQPRNPVIFPAMLKKDLQNLKGDEGGKTVIAKNKKLQYFVEFKSVQQFFDIDTPEAYQNLIERFDKKS